MIVAVRLDFLFTTPGAKVTPLSFSYGGALSHPPLERRLIASAKVQRSFTLTHSESGAFASEVALHLAFVLFFFFKCSSVFRND